jgi:hypothetical protein
MLKPFTEAYIRGKTFATPASPLQGAGGRLSSLGLRSLEPSLCRGPPVHPGPVLNDVRAQETPQQAPPELAAHGEFWWAAQAFAWLLRADHALHADIRAFKRAQRLEEFRPVLAIHVRRGDACDPALNWGNTWRECSGLSEYLRPARRMAARYGYRGVVIVSDDNAILDEARKLNQRLSDFASAKQTWSRESPLPGIERVFVPPSRADGYDGKQRYDDAVRGGAVDFSADARSVLRDLFLIADADGNVGKFSSYIDRIALALGYGRSQCAVPTVSLDIPWCMDYSKLVNVSQFVPGAVGGMMSC